MATNTDPWQATGKSRRKACGECRRLKLRCEKVFPCESCQKRGCAAICPRGSFLKGTRSLKTSALKLHEKMSHMSARIQELEHALAELQASVSAEKHPLLQDPDDEERSRSQNNIPAVTETHVPIGETSDELSEALGALTIRPFGEAQFHGETASSEFLLPANWDAQVLATATGWDSNANTRMQIPPDLVLLSVLFPFPPSIPAEPVSHERFLPFLPDYPEAVRLCDVYYTLFSWCSMPIQREELNESILTEVYGRGTPINLHHISLHKLSLLFMIFAIGTLFDVDKPLHPAEAEEYHSLARAALCGEQIFNNTSLDCVQSMTLMIWYMRLCRRRSKGYLWAFSGLLSKIVQAMGLHRESSKNATPQELLRRQTTFWEYISGDIWQSFVYGRPSSMVFSQIDCKKPRELGGDKTATLFYKWKYSFTHLVGDVISQATGATATSYKTILELERKVRDYPLPAPLKLPELHSSGIQNDIPLPITLQRYVIRLWQHATLMAIHRRFLVQAIRKHPNDVTQSPFLKSVYAAYESACVPIVDLSNLCEMNQRVVNRMQPYWSHVFSAAIVLGALVLRSPSCIVADQAMLHLDQACDMFMKTATTSLQPPDALGLMTNLQRKARVALTQYQMTRGTMSGPEQVYFPLGSSSTNDTSQGSSPASSQAVESPVQHVRPPSPGTYQRQSAQSHANYAAQWLQQQAYFPPGPSDIGVGIGVGLGTEPEIGTAQMPYGIMRGGGAEDDEYAASWLHRQAYFRDRSSSEGRDMEMSPHHGSR